MGEVHHKVPRRHFQCLPTLEQKHVNGHISSDMRSFGEVRGDFGFGQINDGGIRFLDWQLVKRAAFDEYLFSKKGKVAS